jgi:hypothetical protein
VEILWMIGAFPVDDLSRKIFFQKLREQIPRDQFCARAFVRRFA